MELSIVVLRRRGMRVDRVAVASGNDDARNVTRTAGLDAVEEKEGT